MHIAVVGQKKCNLLPALDEVHSALAAKALAFRTVVKIGHAFAGRDAADTVLSR